MNRLTRDGTAELVSRDQFSGANGDREIIIFPVQLTTGRIGNLARLIHTLLFVMSMHAYVHTYIHTYIHTCCSILPQFPQKGWMPSYFSINSAQSVPNVKNAKKHTPAPETQEIAIIFEDGPSCFA